MTCPTCGRELQAMAAPGSIEVRGGVAADPAKQKMCPKYDQVVLRRRFHSARRQVELDAVDTVARAESHAIVDSLL